MFFSAIIRTIKKINPAIFIGIIFFIIPFFWFQPGSLDLGGDGTRLYFYDPATFNKNVSFYDVVPEGKGDIDPARHAYLVYVGLITIISAILHSPYLVITIFNGIKLSVSFISVYFIIKEFILAGEKKKRDFFYIEIPSLIGGIFYTLATAYDKLIFYWSKALHSHDQIFLNPLMFLLILRYLTTKNRWYFGSFLIISFLFSTNFAMISAPPFFAFYPLAGIFLFLYITYIRKISLPIKDLLIGLFLFVGLHAFHLIPELSTLFDRESVTTAVVFKDSGVNYFMAIHGLAKASISLFLPTSVSSLRFTSIIGPFVILFGYLLAKGKNKTILLLTVFFLIIFFLATANITNSGLQLYEWFFNIPGFSMFRNFYSQWAYIFIFFYALLFGLSLSVIFFRFKHIHVSIVTCLIIFFFVIGYWQFLTGELVDAVQWGSKNVKSAMIMDPSYEETLRFIRQLPEEGKMVIFPLTDNYIQVIYGLNNAAYVGPSTISFLTQKKSFAGYQNFYPNPIPEHIMQFSREKKYEALTQIFSIFNIRYIFYNDDPKIYEEKFPNFPNSYMMTSLPKTQAGYKEFIKNFPLHMIYKNNQYKIFEFEKNVYRPEIYIPDSIYTEDMLDVIDTKSVSYQSAFIDKNLCQKSQIISDFCKQKYSAPFSLISIKKNNPTDYIIHIKQTQSTNPSLLVFQNSFHKDWKMSIDNNPILSEDSHVLINKYANAWVIRESDRKGKTDYIVHLTLERQRYFLFGFFVSGFFLFLLLSFPVIMLVKKKFL